VAYPHTGTRQEMISLNDIRREIADRTEDVRDIMLSTQQAKVIRFVRRRNDPTRSRDVCKRFDLSAQHACMVMDNLYRKGYLCRTQQPQESGGYEYEYTWEID